MNEYVGWAGKRDMLCCWLLLSSYFWWEKNWLEIWDVQ
jgi:hypothetical protein